MSKHWVYTSQSVPLYGNGGKISSFVNTCQQNLSLSHPLEWSRQVLGKKDKAPWSFTDRH